MVKEVYTTQFLGTFYTWMVSSSSEGDLLPLVPGEPGSKGASGLGDLGDGPSDV